MEGLPYSFLGAKRPVRVTGGRRAVPTLRTTVVRTVLRFVASVMMVSGTLLIADAGVTLAWQEPISRFLSDRDQHRLETELRHPPPRVLRRQPLKGDAIGKIELPAIHKTAFLVEGTDLTTLRKGPGHYPHTPLPGRRGTVAIAGHRTTYGAPFRHIDSLHRGDQIQLDLPDGTFHYRVQKTQVVSKDATWIVRRVGYDRLVLSACHPLHSAAQRIVVFARYVSRSRATVGRG
jgi:sortase A